MLHLNISEAGMLPEQPRSQTFRQFSISTIKLKSLAKLSKESRLRTINEKGMTQIRLCHEGKKKKEKAFNDFGPSFLHSYITALLLFLIQI